jgi:hypothetical protein
LAKREDADVDAIVIEEVLVRCRLLLLYLRLDEKRFEFEDAHHVRRRVEVVHDDVDGAAGVLEPFLFLELGDGLLEFCSGCQRKVPDVTIQRGVVLLLRQGTEISGLDLIVVQTAFFPCPECFILPFI